MKKAVERVEAVGVKKDRIALRMRSRNALMSICGRR